MWRLFRCFLRDQRPTAMNRYFTSRVAINQTVVLYLLWEIKGLESEYILILNIAPF